MLATTSKRTTWTKFGGAPKFKGPLKGPLKGTFKGTVSSLAAPAGPDSQDLRHMGMWIEGIQAPRSRDAGRGGSDRLLVARNKTSGRRWIVDPITGFGQPEDLPLEPGAQAEIPLPERPPPAEHVAASGGPFPCEHCGKCKMLVLRLPDRSVMKKCLACRRFVVDGRVERAPRTGSTFRPDRASAAQPARRGVGRLPSTPVSLPLVPIS